MSCAKDGEQCGEENAMPGVPLPRMLPQPDGAHATGGGDRAQWYASDQMRAYGKACADAEVAALKAELERLRGLLAAETMTSDVLRRENDRLREWIKQEGDNHNTCTFDVLKQICDDCRCGRGER